MTGIRREAAKQLLAVAICGTIFAVVYFSGGLQFAVEFITTLFKAGKETIANVSDVIESEKSPRIQLRIAGGIDDFRVLLTLEKAPGELKDVRLSITAASMEKNKLVKNVEWATWKLGEEKTAQLEPMTIASIAIEGTAKHDGKEIKIWREVNTVEWKSSPPMPLLDLSRFNLRSVGSEPRKEFRVRSLHPFDLKSLDIAIKTTSKTGDVNESKINREVWRTDEEISFETPDPNPRMLTLEGTAEARGKQVRVAFRWVNND